MEDNRGLLSVLAEALKQYEQNLADKKESVGIALEEKLNEIAKMISSLSDRVDNLSSRINHISDKVDELPELRASGDCAKAPAEEPAFNTPVEDENIKTPSPVYEEEKTETPEPVFERIKTEFAEPVFDAEEIDNRFHTDEEDDLCSEEEEGSVFDDDDFDEFDTEEAEDPEDSEETEVAEDTEVAEKSEVEEESEVEENSSLKDWSNHYKDSNEEDSSLNSSERNNYGNGEKDYGNGEKEYGNSDKDNYGNEEKDYGSGEKDNGLGIVSAEERRAAKRDNEWFDWEYDYPAEYVEDLTGTMGINDKLEFIRELFHSDFAKFEAQLKEIDTMPNFKTIVQFFHQAHPEWDLNSDTVYRFYMHIRRKYRN